MHHAHPRSKGLLIRLYNLALFWKALVGVQHLRAACHNVWVRALVSDIMVYTALAKNNVRPWKLFSVSPFPLSVYLMVSPSLGIIPLFGAQHTFVTQCSEIVLCKGPLWRSATQEPKPSLCRVGGGRGRLVSCGDCCQPVSDRKLFTAGGSVLLCREDIQSLRMCSVLLTHMSEWIVSLHVNADLYICIILNVYTHCFVCFPSLHRWIYL